MEDQSKEKKDESKLNTRLKRDHPRRTITAQADAEQSRGRRSWIGKRPETGLRTWLSGDARQNQAGQPKIRMVENIEKLPFHPQLHAFAERKPLREIEITP